MSEATERPWHHIGAGVVVGGPMREVARGRAVTKVATFKRPEDAEEAVRAVNTHEEAIGLLRRLVEWEDHDCGKLGCESGCPHDDAHTFLDRLDGGTER